MPGRVTMIRVAKYTAALVACVLVFLLYVMLGMALGWKHGGGAIPQLLLVAVWVMTFRQITKRRKSDARQPKP